MEKVVPESMVERAARRFAVLSDANRLRLLNLLLRHSEQTVGALAVELGTSQANVSKHLKLLHDAGVVGRRQEGTAAYYSVTDPSVKQLCRIVCDRITHQAHAEVRALRT
jgi:DNA-binding transcriptional ArsR family regulator